MSIDGSLHWNIPPDISLEITAAALDHISKHIQRRWRDKEAGGQLFARISQRKWTIVRVTGPRSTDWRSRFGFRPDRKAERREILELFDEGLHYIGDWHTHPENRPTPSCSDIKSMRETVQQSTHTLPGFIMIIAGRDNFPSGLWASFHQLNGEMLRLNVTDGPDQGLK